MQRFVVYTRVSTKKQGDSGLGLDAQERDIQLFLDNYSEVPFEVVARFQDVESGTRSDRPELAKALTLAKTTGATLLVAKLDRLSRSVAFIAQLLEDKKLNFRVASMPYADKFQLHIYAALAEQERDFISKRTKAALQEAKARGVKLGGYREGHKAHHEAIRQNADKAAQRVASTILSRRAAGATFQAIADELNALGVATARNGQWYATTVRNYAKRLEALET
ncbi:recombinase family protein [Aliiroseovarius sp. xm-g-7]|uniref:recombinase family protein n=1 Tax=Aliiroseovarius sp. xm-g-7 TaxID=2651826 RepID=UPI00156876D4|nr:recombinase family protein [Aliiroseovarius sp. xm-g-7]NRQ27750.1 DNA-invertase hin [Aliiroseovarius sp. xm-g-7]